MASELERTRRYEVSDFPPGTRMLLGDRRDLDAAIAQGGIKAVGKFQPRSGGLTAVPVVYVSKRSKPFLVRHKVAAIVLAALVTLASGIAAIIATVGVAWFVGGIFLAAAAIALLSRMSGGGRHRAVSVTTTTTTNVRVR